jgi:translation initiation factor IF-1
VRNPLLFPPLSPGFPGFRAAVRTHQAFLGHLVFRLVGEAQSADGTGPEEQDFMKEQHIEVEGVVNTVLPGTMFRVALDNQHLVLATISGKMRKRWVRLTVGDRVRMEMSPYDLDKARIVWRLK